MIPWISHIPLPNQSTLCEEEKFKDYSDVDSEDTKSLIHHPTQSRFLRPAIIILYIIVIIVPVIYFTVAQQKNVASHPKYDQCGTTAAEARDRGCVFETTGFTWLPKECHDRVTEEEFISYIIANDLNLSMSGLL
ncbi:hypothetical protein EJ02DRAFT_467289 [Clathrospora elynae]|uniref:Uncharacterized protein n=1 Tax=Clathrospora elynae TaxID=706981 RepID=A0A6A5SIW2_9PLEO|nr:hypothetical protein EJ02DRAFT_467289 [Clathrospora elynae]